MKKIILSSFICFIILFTTAVVIPARSWTQTYVGDIHSNGQIGLDTKSVPAVDYFSIGTTNDSSGVIVFGENETVSRASIGLGTSSAPGNNWELFISGGLPVDTSDYTYSSLRNKIASKYYDINQSNSDLFDAYPDVNTNLTVQPAEGIYAQNGSLHIDTNLDIPSGAEYFFIIGNQITLNSAHSIQVQDGGILILESLNGKINFNDNSNIHIFNGGTLFVIAGDNIEFDKEDINLIIDPGGTLVFLSGKDIQVKKFVAGIHSYDPALEGIFIGNNIQFSDPEYALYSDTLYAKGIFIAHNNIELKSGGDPNTHIIYNPSLLIEMSPLGKSIFYRKFNNITWQEVAP